MNALLTMKTLAVLALLAAVARAGSADADKRPQPVNLASVMRLAGARNLDIRLATHRLEQARAEHEAVRLQWFPYLQPGFVFRGHDGNIQIVDGPVVDARKQLVSVGAAVAIELQIGETWYRTLITRNLARAAAHGLDVQRQESVWQAVSAYFELVRASAAVGVANDSVDIARNYAAQVRQAVDAGIAFKGDAFRANVQVERNEIVRRQAREQQRIASARLAQLLNVSPDIEVLPSEGAPSPVRFAEMSLPLDILTARALESRPEMKLNAEQLDAAIRASQGARWAQALPTLRADYFYGGLGGGVGDAGTRQFNDSHEYGVGLTWRIGPGGLFDSSRAHLADAKQRGMQVERDKLRNEIVRQVVEAYARVVSLTDQLGHARKALDAAGESLKLASGRRAFAVGEVLENIVAEQELTRARLEYLNVVTEHNRVQFLLRRAIGAESGGPEGK